MSRKSKVELTICVLYMTKTEFVQEKIGTNMKVVLYFLEVMWKQGNL